MPLSTVVDDSPDEGPVTYWDLRRLFSEFTAEASRANLQIAVPLHQATLMLGMKDDQFTQDLIQAGRLRTRQEPNKKTKLISVQSIREYMGDVPRKGGRR